MDLFAREKLGWFPTLRQPPGYSTFFKPRFLRIQWYPNFHMRRISFWNGLFDSDFFLRSSCTLKVSNFRGGTGYCYVISLSKDMVWASSLWTEWINDRPSSQILQSSFYWLSSVATAWQQNNVQPISCHCVDNTAWSDDIMLLSRYNECLKMSRIIACRLVQNVFAQATLYFAKTWEALEWGRRWGLQLVQILVYSPHNATKRITLVIGLITEQ